VKRFWWVLAMAVVVAATPLGLASSASASEGMTAVLAESTLSPDTAEIEGRATDAVSAALTGRGIRVLTAAEKRAKLRERADTLCDGLDCAASVLRALGTDMLVAVAVSVQGERTDVIVTLVDPEERHVDGTARVESEGLETASRAALAMALERWPARGGVPVRVEGSPLGAAVTVDGRPAGTLPLDLRLVPGTHRLAASMLGHKTEEQDLAVPPDASRPLLVSFALAPTEAPERPTAGWDYALGGALAATALTYGVAGFVALAKDGRCEQYAGGGCTDRYVFEGRDAARYAVPALVAAGLAVPILWKRPIQLLLGRQSDRSAWLSVKGSF
jgi:hypothetical protein